MHTVHIVVIDRGDIINMEILLIIIYFTFLISMPVIGCIINDFGDDC